MQSADRALAILAAFSTGRSEVGVSELAAELGTHKSTVSRLLAVLQARGFVRREGDRFSPGPELARLGVLAQRSRSLVDAARGPLERLAAETGETVNLAVRRSDEALNVYQVATAHRVGATDWTGRAAPLHATANGKVLLAFGDGALPQALPALTPRTITGVETLRAELERVRRRGFATTLEELELGLIAVAAPVFEATGACGGAVSVSGPAYRLTSGHIDGVARACIAAADEISARLGYSRAA